MSTTYIYHLCCPFSGEVRYIGKSVNPPLRLKKHLQAAAKPENYNQRWIATLLAEDRSPVLKVVYEVLPDEDWREVEIAAIAAGFAAGWRLTNTSIGGEGPRLRDPADEARRIESCRAAWRKPEIRKQQSIRQKEIQNRPELVEDKRQRMLKRWESPEYAKANSEIVKAFYSTPEARKLQSERTLKANLDPAVRSARANGIKEAWSDPEKKKAWVEALTAAQNTPKAKASKSEIMKARHQDPEWREKMKKVMADPEMIAKRNLAISASKQKKKAEKLSALANSPQPL